LGSHVDVAETEREGAVEEHPTGCGFYLGWLLGQHLTFDGIPVTGAAQREAEAISPLAELDHGVQVHIAGLVGVLHLVEVAKHEPGALRLGLGDREVVGAEHHVL
jgi:hypothetical protein